MDRIYRRQRHVYDLTRKYYLLGRDRLIDRLDAAGRRPRARDRLRHGAQPDRRGRALSAGAFLRPRHLGRDAEHGAPDRRPRRRRASHRAGARRRHRLRSAALFGVPAFRPHLLLLQPVDDPGLAGRADRGDLVAGAGRRAARRRLRQPGAPAGLVPRRPAPGWRASMSARAMPCRSNSKCWPAVPERSSASSGLTAATPSMPSSDAELAGWRSAAAKVPGERRSSARTSAPFR